ncbi:hypothetical protein MNBD_GAMMA07-2403 [hydrothermal vent metagenome]|uniref:Uncharacterized protein n=1 Tax=hydrothermal vent metagenome TaxID=652676 RepID=A0A3B0XGJ5_9ZZZZ
MFELYENITVIISISLLVTGPLTTVLLLIQYYIHKKILDPTYYNSNHFSAGELVIFSSGFIFYLYKTLAYVRAIALPKTMRIRFKENILTYKNHPFIYILACFTMLLIAYGGLVIINLIIFASFYEYRN